MHALACDKTRHGNSCDIQLRAEGRADHRMSLCQGGKQFCVGKKVAGLRLSPPEPCRAASAPGSSLLALDPSLRSYTTRSTAHLRSFPSPSDHACPSASSRIQNSLASAGGLRRGRADQRMLPRQTLAVALHFSRSF